jgi:GxxExxY protein
MPGRGVFPMKVRTALPVETETIVRRTIGCAVAVHRALGPGFLERTYQEALCVELRSQVLRYEREKSVMIRYRGEAVGAHRLDLVVEGALIVEVKAVERLDRTHVAQVLAYLKATDLRVGLLLNFSGETLAGGIRRVVR